MNSVFSADDIQRARKLVKTATMVHNPVAVNGPGNYNDWLGPKSILEPAPAKKPGLLASLGRSVLGTVGDFGGDRVRSFVGLGPGPSTVSGLASYAPKYLWGRATGNRADIQEGRAGMRAAFDVPYSAARSQSAPAQYALADYFTKNLPGLTKAVTMPVQSFKEWIHAPGAPQFEAAIHPTQRRKLPPQLVQPKQPVRIPQ